MPKPKQIRVNSTVIRHHPQFSRLVKIPLAAVSKWKLSGTTVVEGTINGSDLGRRSMKLWDERKCWWIDLPEALCKRLKIETGDKVTLNLRLASEDLPEELRHLLKTEPRAKDRWGKLTPAQQRMIREEIFAAKSSQTRKRRATKALLN